MALSLNEYRVRLLDRILALLWSQWSSVGVAGYDDRNQGRIVDPEALFAITCTMARYDSRLFDEVLEWLAANERQFNTQRLRGIFKVNHLSGAPVAEAAMLALSRHVAAPKPTSKSVDHASTREREPLFLFPDGSPLPTRGDCDPDFAKFGFVRAPLRIRHQPQPPLSHQPPTLLLRLRALLGVSARCEILAYLLCNGSGHSHEIARRTGYYQKTVYDALADMERSGIVISVRHPRIREFRIASQEFIAAFTHGHRIERWVDWPPLFAALEAFWTGISRLSRRQPDDWEVLAELHLLGHAFVEAFNVLDFPAALLPPTPQSPLQVLVQPVETVLDLLIGRQSETKVIA